MKSIKKAFFLFIECVNCDVFELFGCDESDLLQYRAIKQSSSVFDDVILKRMLTLNTCI